MKILGYGFPGTGIIPSTNASEAWLASWAILARFIEFLVPFR